MSYLTSSIGRKQLMGITGLVWSGFVLGHMIGNLLILVSAEAYNKYAHAIVSNKLLLYGTEVVLVLTLLPHIFNGLVLWVENRRSQGGAKKTQGTKAPRWQSKWMAAHGSLILVFVILHLITFKYGTHYTVTYDGVEMRDLHKLIVEVFHIPGYVIWYLVALVLLGFHLSHGFYSAFASIGFYHPKYSPVLNKAGYLYATIVALGFISQPLYVWFCAPAP